MLARIGLFTAHTESRAWTIPAHRALCVPDGSRLRIETGRRVGIRCLYTRSELGLLGDEVRVVNLDPLTHALIAHAIDTAPMNLDEPADTALITLLANQLSRLPDAPLQLPLPTDPTAMAVAAAIMAQPAVSLHDQLRTAAASRRTLERRFKTETRMSLGQWRRRACILSAVAMLADGDNVTSVALRVGYASPSSFIAAFRAELDSAPREFMRTAPASPPAGFGDVNTPHPPDTHPGEPPNNPPGPGIAIADRSGPGTDSCARLGGRSQMRSRHLPGATRSTSSSTGSRAAAQNRVCWIDRAARFGGSVVLDNREVVSTSHPFRFRQIVRAYGHGVSAAGRAISPTSDPVVVPTSGECRSARRWRTTFA